MEYKTSNRKRRKTIFALLMMLLISGAIIITLILFAIGMLKMDGHQKSPEQILLAYMDCISEKRYQEMYGMLTEGSAKTICKKDFIARNSAIYEGIEMKNMRVVITGCDKKNHTVKYNTSFDTVAGNVSFENEAVFLKEDGGYKLIWSDSVIFPGLGTSDKVRVSTVQAKRGEILDRNGRMLAGKGMASSVGIIPGKLQNRQEAVKKMAKLLEMKAEDIEKQLSAKWVRNSSFVPIKTLPKIRDTNIS